MNGHMSRWNGIISEIAHQRTDTGTVITNGYFYDPAGRLTDHIRYDGSSQTNKYTERDLSFDRNGNILTLKRFGTNIAAPQDNLAYTYEGNKLMQLNNATYLYDANGNMTHDGRRGLDLSWNHLNLPATISTVEDEDATVNYTYLSDGTKVLAQAPGTGEGYAYLGSMVYKLNNGSWALETTPFTGGRFVRNASGNFVEQRHITDHLGSTRAIVEGGDYIEVEQNDYYPFGKRIADNSLQTTPTNRWRFSGKEIQTLGGINLIDFGARLYDTFIGRWEVLDPLSEKGLQITPYAYCDNNPILYIDDGGQEKIVSLHRLLDIKDRRYSNNRDKYKKYNEDLKVYKKEASLRNEANRATDYSNILSIYAHGNPTSIYYRDEHNNLSPKDADALGYFIQTNSSTYKQRDERGGVSAIVLFSCSTGNGDDSLASQLSGILSGSIVVAPSDLVQGNGKVENSGVWNIYIGGELFASLSGDSSVITSFMKALDNLLEQRKRSTDEDKEASK